MLLRSAAFSFAAALTFAAPAFADTPAQCEATSFRVYFERNSADLNAAAYETLDAAARHVAGCGAAQMSASSNADSPLGTARAAAIARATRAYGWTPAATMQPIAFGAGPDFIEITIAPNQMPMTTAGAGTPAQS
jgi:outer membrane protein OmpA-like peptidoglycan-associated protein